MQLFTARRCVQGERGMNMAQMSGDDVLQALRRYSSMVYRLAYARTRSRADAEDIYQ